jgi:PAS domain S-box-containing protein
MDRKSRLLLAGAAPVHTVVAGRVPLSPVVRYGVAIIATLVAVLLKLAAGPIILPTLYVPSYGAVLVSAWVGGVGPGVLTSVLSFALGQLLFVPPPAPTTVVTEVARDVLFLIVAIGMSWGTAALRTSQRRLAEVLQAGRDELEARVALRTTELREANRQLTDEVARRSEAEERFRNSFEHAPIGMALVSADGRPLQINAALCRMLGYTHDELLPKPIAEVMHPDDLAGANADRARLLAGEVHGYRAERRYLHRSGAVVWVEMSVSLVRDRDGRPVNLVSHLHDISDRKQAEEALRRSEELLKNQATWLQSILNSLGEAVVVADANGKLLYFNPVAERLHGRGRADVPPEEWSREYGVCFPDGTPVPAEELPIARARRGEVVNANQEFAIRPVGQDTLVPVQVTATPIISEDGSHLGGVVVYRDISSLKEAEAQLRRNEERLREAERLAHVGAWEWELASDTVTWSDEQFRILGLDVQSIPLTSQTLLGMVAEEDRDRVVEAIADALAGRRPYDIECRVVRPDGEVRDVHGRGEVVRDAAQQPIRMLGTILDITERKRFESVLEARVAQRTTELQEEIRQRGEVESALRDSEQRFRAIFEQAAVGVTMVDAEGRGVLINRRLCEILGYSRAELSQLRLRDVTHPDDVESSAQLIRQLVAGERDAYKMEKRYIRKDGSVIWVGLTASAVRDAAGTVKNGIVVVWDITARKRAEEELRAAEERLRQLVEHLPAITYVLALDAAQSTLYISPQIETTLGFTPAEWIADPDLWNRQLHPDDRARVIAEVHASHATGEPFSSEYRMYTRSGAVAWFRDEAVVIRDERDQLLFTQGVMIDITARRLAEDELEATNRRVRSILEEITDGFYLLDEEGRFTYLNPSALRLFERSAEQLLGTKLWDAFPEGIGTPFHDQYQRMMAERVPVAVEAYYAPRNRWFRAHGYPMQRGASVLFEDVTERHEHEVSVMNDILGQLNAHLDVDEAFPAVAASLRQLTGCERSSVTGFEDGDEWVRVVALDKPREYVREGVRFRLADVPAARDALEGRAHVVSDLAEERRFPAMRLLYAAGYRSRLSIPLQGRERVLGVLNLLWREVDGPRRVQLPLINQVAAMIALALEKSRLFEEVRTGRERLEALSHRLLEVQEAERQHIARELHDQIGQALTALKLSLDTIVGATVDGVATRLKDTRNQVNELLGRVRKLALDLRPAMLDDLGLLPALLWLFERYSAQAGVQVNFEHRGLERRFDPDIETAAFRIVQEALTNAVRHAGVQEVTVRAWRDVSTVSVQIVDRGVGFDAEAAMAAGQTSGMAGMRERAVLLGGHLTVESAPGTGTRVSAELPVDDAADEVTVWP